MSITDIIKESLKYPQRNLKNTTFFAGFLMIFFILEMLCGSVSVSKITWSILGNSGTILSSFNTMDWIIIAILIVVSLITYLFIQGYIYRVYHGDEKPPEFNNFKSMLFEGLKIVATTIVYDILPIIVVFIGFYVTAKNIFTNGYILCIIGLILLLIMEVFLKPFAIANMVKNDDFREAFNLNLIMDRIIKIGILPYIGSVIFIFIINSIIWATFTVLISMSALMLLIPVVNVLIMMVILIFAAFIHSYLNLFSNKVYQLLYS